MESVGEFGFCYDPYDPGWGGKAQPGAVALRNVTMRRVSPVGDLGILRDRSRCNKSSAHCYGRAWDAAIGPDPEEIPIGTALAEFFVLPEVASMLGIQRVIWGFGSGQAAREWDSRTGQRYWSAYSGPLHDEHVHVELCWEAAKRLTEAQVEQVFDRYWPGAQEDFLSKLTEEEQRDLYDKVKVIWKDHGDTGGGAYKGVLEDVDGGLGAYLLAMEDRIVARVIAAVKADT